MKWIMGVSIKSLGAAKVPFLCLLIEQRHCEIKSCSKLYSPIFITPKEIVN